MNEAYIVTLCTMSRDLMHDTKDIKMDPPDIKLVSFVDTYDKAKETMKKGLDDLMSNPENNIISLQYVGENAVYVFDFDEKKRVGTAAWLQIHPTWVGPCIGTPSNMEDIAATYAATNTVMADYEPDEPEKEEDHFQDNPDAENPYDEKPSEEDVTYGD